MELLADQVASFAHNQPSIVRPVGQKIDQPLETSKSWAGTVLILVRPWLVFLEIFTVGEAQVHRIEGHDQVFRLVDLFKNPNHAWLSANGPGECLMRKAISCAHALLVDDRQVLLEDGRRIVAIESESAGA